jgi:AraC-like DNA-binding protein
MLSRRNAPTAPASVTYEPSVAVVAQGRKRADLGHTTFIFDESRYLLTSVDLPIVSQVIEASEQVPFLCLLLKLEMPVVRELLSLEEIPVPGPPPYSPAMATGETTVELLDACCRLVGLQATPRDIPFLSGLIQREIIYRLLRGPKGARLRAIATLGDQSHRTAKVIAWLRTNFTRPLRVEDLAQIAGMGMSTFPHHFRALTAMSPLQCQKQLRLHAARGRMLVDGLDAASALSKWIRKRLPVQPRVQPLLRPAAHARRPGSPAGQWRGGGARGRRVFAIVIGRAQVGRTPLGGPPGPRVPPDPCGRSRQWAVSPAWAAGPAWGPSTASACRCQDAGGSCGESMQLSLRAHRSC